MARSVPPQPGELDRLDPPDGEGTGQAVVEGSELPVVARLVVEIRSDGTRTIARGALEDPEGHRVAVEAQGTTPWALAKQLAGALWTMPRLGLGRSSLRALLPGRRRTRG
jgi:hypothetical protein